MKSTRKFRCLNNILKNLVCNRFHYYVNKSFIISTSKKKKKNFKHFFFFLIWIIYKVLESLWFFILKELINIVSPIDDGLLEAFHSKINEKRMLRVKHDQINPSTGTAMCKLYAIGLGLLFWKPGIENKMKRVFYLPWVD